MAASRHRGVALRRVKLQQASRTSALLSGFALVAMVELDLPVGRANVAEYDNDPAIIAFALITALLISVHLFALMVSTCILPYLDLEQDTWLDELESEDIVEDLSPPLPVKKATADRHAFSRYIEMAWIFATGLGIFLFLLDLALLSYLKFVAHSPTAGWCVIGLLVPVSAIFAWFAAMFYSTVVRNHTNELSQHASHLDQLHRLAKAMDHDGNDVFHSPTSSGLRSRVSTQRPSLISHEAISVL